MAKRFFRKGKKSKSKSKSNTDNQPKVYSYKDYIEKIKSLKKYQESIDYLKMFYESSSSDTKVDWKFKSNLQTFIKKHILIKDLFNKENFTYFQHYFIKMAGKEQFIEICQEIIKKIHNNEFSLLNSQIFIHQLEELEEEEKNNFWNKILKRCSILIENN
jgi:hypothetical protein